MIYTAVRHPGAAARIQGATAPASVARLNPIAERILANYRLIIGTHPQSPAATNLTAARILSSYRGVIGPGIARNLLAPIRAFGGA